MYILNIARQDTQGEQCKTRTGYKTEQDLTDGVGNQQSSIALIDNEGKTSTTEHIKTKIMYLKDRHS